MRATVTTSFAVMLAAATAVLLAGCVTTDGGDAGIRDGRCQEDFTSRVQGGPICFLIETVRPGSTPPRTLMVFVHGDPQFSDPKVSPYSNGMGFLRLASGDWRERPMRHFGPIVAVGIWRPGVSDGLGNRSSGHWARNYGDNRSLRIAGWVAEAIRRLRDHHGVQQVVVVGHSGGAQLTAGIISEHHGLVQLAVLHGCICNTSLGGSSAGIQNLEFNPIGIAHRVDKATKVVAITGGHDKVTPPAQGRQYAAILRGHGVDAVFHESPLTGHSMPSPEIMWRNLFRALGRDDLAG